MREQEYRTKEKKVNRMTREGLVEDNLATGNRKNISKREVEADFCKTDDSLFHERQSIRADLERRRQREKPHEGRKSGCADGETSVHRMQDTAQTTAGITDAESGEREENEAVRDSPKRSTSTYPQDKAGKSLYKKQHYRKRGDIQPGRLQFDKEEAGNASSARGSEETPKLQHLEQKAEKAASKLEHGKNAQPKKRSLKIQRVYNGEMERAGHRLYFEETPKGMKKNGVARRTSAKIITSAGNFTHRKVSQVEKENSGVEATHKSEQAAETVLRLASKRNFNRQRKQQSKIRRLEKKAYRTNVNYQYGKYAEENPQRKKKALNKFFQKRRIKKEYQKAYKKGRAEGSAVKQSAGFTTKIAKKLREMLAKNKMVLVIGLAIGVLLVFIMAGFSSCSMMFSDTVGTTFFSCWLSKPEEIDQAELELTRREVELQSEIDNVEQDYPGYDEYRYNVGAIGHSPFEYISYLSAKYVDFTIAEAAAEADSIFHEMYAFSTSEVVEIRTRTETHTVTDPVTGEESVTEVEVEYEHYILDVKLIVKPLTAVIEPQLDAEQRELYEAYADSKGGLQQLGTPLPLYWYSYISSYYGYRKHPASGTTQLHRGVDIAVPEGTEVLAGHTGTVTAAAYHSEYGNYVVIEDGVGYMSKYAHLSSLSVSAGQSVAIGDRIGATGSTGSSSGSHLHIEVLYNGEYYNPLFYFNVGEGTLYGEEEGENITPPDSYDDATADALIREAERYLGMPYTFGGTPPSSFDCSAFVCWAFTNSGVHDLPRTTAQGIYDQCSTVSAGEARAGDIIFFTGTYNAGRPVTHVGIYCGNGIMIHCGDPIQYTSINTSYWQSHFYGFGRLH